MYQPTCKYLPTTDFFVHALRRPNSFGLYQIQAPVFLATNQYYGAIRPNVGQTDF